MLYIRMKKIFVFLAAVSCLYSCTTTPKTMKDGWWRASLQRADGYTIDFNIEVKTTDGKPVWSIRNAGERLEVTDIKQEADSILVQMPVFESGFYLKITNDTIVEGKWTRQSSIKELTLPVTFIYNQPNRYPLTQQQQPINVTGRWAVNFNTEDDAVAEFVQNGEILTGTFLTPTGDYRYLEGTVSGNSLRLSTFDGSHAYFFSASIQNDSTLTNGIFCSGPTFKDQWTALKDSAAAIPDTASAVYLKPGQDKLDFRFPDIDSNMVSINDEKFKNKAVVIQIMGSWCPNCMDETAFISEYYQNNKQRGVEMIALAYEYSTDFQRSQKGLRKFQKKFNMQYPILITGVKVSDTLRTEKTLPQITPIQMFPTTIFIGKDGKVKKIHTGFNGPGTGEHYEKFKREFEATIDELLKG